MAVCDICGKGAQVGHNIQHQASGQWRYRAPKTRRVWKANVQKTTVVLGGIARRRHVCSRCLRTLAKTASA